MAKKYNILEENLDKIVSGVIKEVASANLNERNDSNLLVEMARINTKDRGLFPFNDFEVKILSNDHNPPHFHIIKDGWNVTFSIESGEVISIGSQGEKKQIYKYMTENVVKWLSSPCAILPAVSNQDNAMAVWTQLHDGR